MKKFLSIVLVSLMLSLTIDVNAETIQIGSGTTVIGTEEYTTLDNLLDIRPHVAIICDQLGEYGEKSDEKNQFLLINIDICNVSDGDVDLSSIFSAELSYMDRYSFESYGNTTFDNSLLEKLTGLWSGSCTSDWASQGVEMNITDVSGEGKISGIFSFTNNEGKAGSYTIPGKMDAQSSSLSWSGLEWIEQPNNYSMDTVQLYFVEDDCLAGNFNGKADSFTYFIKQKNDEVINTLSMLEEISYPLVFKIPNRVADDLDNCKVEISVNGNSYMISLK